MNARVEELRRRRPRDRFVRWSLLALALLALLSCLFGGFSLGDLPAERRAANLTRFLREILPYPIQQGEMGWSELPGWCWERVEKRAGEAALNTLYMSVTAIVLAAAVAFFTAPLAARNLASGAPFLPQGRPTGRMNNAFWRSLSASVRGFYILARAIPEYIWAFLFLAVFGPQAWTVVLALAMHNAGILGRLGAEVLENAERTVPVSLRAIGAGRAQITVLGLLPQAFSRFLVYFFYRWETCVREATILGMLGMSTLGYWIREERARDHYDEMIFLVLLGAGLVFCGDAVSALVRAGLRRKT